MSYTVKEMFLTLQGEGKNAGRTALFIRFAGCNLWSGREEDRLSAECRFCDTEFVGTDGTGGGKFSIDEMVDLVEAMWPGSGKPFIVFTGGEPGLQLDQSLVDALHKIDAEIAVETNGTLPLPKNLDWITMSPKAGTEIVVTKGNECKLVFPQDGLNPDNLLKLDFDHFLLQPMDSDHREENTSLAVDYCLKHPEWSLSLQTHKMLNIP